MYRRLGISVAAAALVVAVALPVSIAAQKEGADDTVMDSRVTVEVDNGNWLDVRVFAVRENGAYDRVGTVTSFSSEEFMLPRWVTASGGQIQLVAVPIGSRQSYASPPIFVNTGEVIEWKLTNNLALSSIFVRTG